MADFTIARTTDELYKEIDKKRNEGYKEYELSVLSRTKLHLDDLHDSEISLLVTSGTFSDKIAKVLTGEDSEEAVLSHYDLSESEKERYKKEILNDHFILVSSKDKSDHIEVEEANAAYAQDDKEGQHYAAESDGPKS